MALMQKTVVFTNGCFDLLHYGHADYLAKARSLGDVLIVGVNTDASVSRLKGTGRPVQDEKSRCMVLASMLCVDYVVLFDEDTPYNLIQSLQPDVLVKGADYKPQDIVGYDIVTANNGRVQTIEFAQGYSTSAIIDKILTTK
ncbi:MAG: D-glycero-beta-D-manno-heptose 1-phosphate adenylyltransferase [Bacteroidales bacterium]|nr:D-glycero-beta-D-manno-heptose 1-phosphate adenylyltransferase [Bacteroidales bacterium]MBQ7984655.1 D-glycero-beta-D-manno-heptose 1-phosphate adenylyltransferase [Bacteroidales bacterium]